MTKIKIIKSFRYALLDRHPTLDLEIKINEGYARDMNELENLATLLNAERHFVTIRFSGDTKNGLKWSIECDDEAMGTRIRGFFRQWKIEQDKFHDTL